MHKGIKFCLSWFMILIMGISLLPEQFVYAFDQTRFTVTSVTIGKTYDRNRIIENMYITITGTSLKDANVGIVTYKGGIVTLGNREINSEGELQFRINQNQLGEFISIEGIRIPINEANMPTLTEVRRNVKIGTDDLEIKGTGLSNLGNSELNIDALFGRENNYKSIKSLSHTLSEDKTVLKVEKPSGELGLQELIFKSKFTNKNVNFNNGKSNDVEVQINYTYLDQFRFTKDLAIEGTLEMFPNRGEPRDTVYFTANKLDEYDVFFLKNLDGTDPYSNTNKGLNTVYKAKSLAEENDFLTTQVPNLPVGEYYVVLTNKISQGKDPMQEVTGETIITDKFTIIDGRNKAIIIDVQPNRGADTGELVTISGQFIGSLNVSEFAPSAESTMVVNQNSTPDALKVEYGHGTYGPSGIKIKKAERTIRVIIGNKANFIKRGSEYDVSFNNDLDKITVRAPQITDADTNPVKDVVIETETVLTKEDGNTITIKERAVKINGYTFILSKVKPEITDAVPKQIQVTNNNGALQIPSDRYMAVYGKNFMIHKYTNADGREVVRYPIVELGPNLRIDKNNPSEDFNDPNKSLNGRNDVILKVFDSTGRELDGSSGSEIGTKILIKLEEGTPATGVALGKAYIRLTNPMRNSKETGLDTQILDYIEFVNPDTSKNPIIQNVNPNVVSVDGGEDIIVTGSNFTDGVKIFIDGAEVKPIRREADGKTITFKAPKGREGQTQLQVMNIEGGMDIYPFIYVKTFTDPKITSIEPRKGNTGTLVVVKGENFLKPDPTGGVDGIYRLIGTRILLEGKEINSYNINTSTREIELRTFSPKQNLFTIQNGTLNVANYYHSILLRAGERLYTIDVDSSGVPIISDGIGNDYTVKLDETKTKLKADKLGGGLFDLTILDNKVMIGQTPPLELEIVTPYEEKEGIVTGDRVKVIDKNTIYFTVPVLPSDGWYDVTVQNPDTKKDTRKDEQGFYYYKQPLSRPAITKIEPEEGSVYGNNIITITGKDFIDTGYEKIKVFINGVEVSPNNINVATSGSSMTVVVPPYNGDLMKDKGVGRWTVPVVIINPDGGNDSMENAYTYVVPSSNPRIQKIVPASGTAAGGAIVEITGSDFRDFEPFEDYNRNQVRDKDEPYTDLNKNGIYDDKFDIEKSKVKLDPPISGYNYYYESPLLPKVYFGMQKARIVEFNSTYIKVLTPKATVGTAQVFIENNDSGRSNSVNYTYEGSKPIITKVSPNAGNKAGRTGVTIYGSDFRESNVKVYNDSVDKKKNLTTVLVQFGDNTNKSIDRDKPNSGLINAGNAQVSLEKDFTAVYNAVYNAHTNPSPSITIRLKHEDILYFNTFTNFNDEESFINTKLLVDNEGRQYPYSELIKFSVVDRRFIVERGFAPATSYISSGEITVTTPFYHTVGRVPIRVINPDGGIGTSTFEYLNPASKPTITDITSQNISPTSEVINLNGKEITARIIRVNHKGGNTIRILGSDFRENAVISIGNILDIPSNRINFEGIPTRLTFDMPAVPEGAIGKYYRLVVLNEDGASASSDKIAGQLPIYIIFTKGESNPSGSSITPNKGPSSGGTKVTIEGKDFRDTMAGFNEKLRVYFGEVPASNISVSMDGKYIYATTPAHEPGEVEVKIQNPDGTVVILPNKFTFISNPKIVKVMDLNELNEIKVISVEGGQEVKLKGYGFKAGARVYFNPVIRKIEGNTQGTNVFYIDGEAYTLESGIEAKEVEFIDEETLKVITPEGNKDSLGVIIINSDGGASSIYALSYSLPEVSAPGGVRADLVYDRYIKIVWDSVPDVIEYEIYAVIDNRNMEMIGTTKLNSFIYEDLEPRTRYKFIVKALGEFNISKASKESNMVRTGSVTGNPDIDGELNEKTIIRKNGNWAEITLGREDYNTELTIDLIRGPLSGATQVDIRMASEVVTSYYSKNITIIGRDFVLVINPKAFKTEKMLANRYNKDSGIRFRMFPNTGNLNLESGMTALSTEYVLEATQYIGKSSEKMEHLDANILLNLDYNGNMASMRRLNTASFNRYDASSRRWVSLKKVETNEQMAIGTYINRLGRYMVVGSKR